MSGPFNVLSASEALHDFVDGFTCVVFISEGGGRLMIELIDSIMEFRHGQFHVFDTGHQNRAVVGLLVPIVFPALKDVVAVAIHSFFLGQAVFAAPDAVVTVACPEHPKLKVSRMGVLARAVEGEDRERRVFGPVATPDQHVLFNREAHRHASAKVGEHLIKLGIDGVRWWCGLHGFVTLRAGDEQQTANADGRGDEAGNATTDDELPFHVKDRVLGSEYIISQHS